MIQINLTHFDIILEMSWTDLPTLDAYIIKFGESTKGCLKINLFIYTIGRRCPQRKETNSKEYFACVLFLVIGSSDKIIIIIEVFALQSSLIMGIQGIGWEFQSNFFYICRRIIEFQDCAFMYMEGYELINPFR